MAHSSLRKPRAKNLIRVSLECQTAQMHQNLYRSTIPHLNKIKLAVKLQRLEKIGIAEPRIWRMNCGWEGIGHIYTLNFGIGIISSHVQDPATWAASDVQSVNSIFK